MLHRQCEVRVREARHLVRKHRKRNGDDKAIAGGVCVLVSHDGVHVSTEVCRDIENPSWERVVVFDLVLRDGFGAKEGISTKPSTRERSSSTPNELTATATREREMTQSLNPFATTQSLNPFASNFVPPAGPALPLPSSVALLPLRTSLVLHLRLLSDSLVSREVLGDLAVDLVPLLESRGRYLATDRLGHVGEVPLEGLPDRDTLAVDTWVSLRQRTAELRLQIVVKPGSQGPVNGRGTEHTRQHRPAKLKKSRSGLLLAPEASVGSRAPNGNYMGKMKLGAQFGDWSTFDEMERNGLVKTSLNAEQRSLDGRLLEVQEKYNFSAASGYRKGRPDEDLSKEGENGANRNTAKVPEWPPCEEDAAQLRRDMQLAALRDRRQSIAWAEKLGSSTSLQHVLRRPPPFGVLRRSRQGATRSMKEKALDEPAMQQLRRDIKELVVQGFPVALLRGRAEVDSSSSVGERTGSAFEGEHEELSFLDDVITAIPHVGVVRVSGRICCAEYQLQVTRESSGDSWFVIRRYSDFMELYNNLPRSFAIITPPLPPKSWRSLSFLSMTPEFLEDRRVALEVALRRLTINAVRADAAVQADLRAFLGFPSYPGRSWLSGLDAELVRHLVRVPSNLELVLSARALTPIPLFSNLRLTMWMLLSGAAHKSSATEDREQYGALVSVADETEWCHQGGTAGDYSLAAAVFQTIDEDVNRTNVESSAERERVRRVLRAFAMKNPRTGYCQGMNSVALFLLKTAEGREDVTFWLLDALATTVIPGHWEQLSHINATDDGTVTIRTLMSEGMPQLLEHLDTRGLPPEVLVCDFMLSLGCRALPPTSLLRCMDLLFWEGRDTLQYVALAVLHLAEDKLLSVQGASATSVCLTACTAAMHDADSLIDFAISEMDRSIDKSTADTTQGSQFDATSFRHRPP